MSLNFIKREAAKISSGSFELYRRRLNWQLVTQDKIHAKFQEIADAAFQCNYPFRLFCIVNDQTINEATVQLSSGANKTGVIERTQTPQSSKVACEVEKGAALVASLSSTGSVAFIIYPYKSDRYARNEENILLHVALSPDDVTEKLINKCIAKYLLYIRNSSVYGTYANSLIDFLKINLMILIDVRNRRKIYKGFWVLFVEWSRIIGAGLAGYIVAVLTRTP